MKSTLLFLSSAALSLGITESFTSLHSAATHTLPTTTSLPMMSNSNSGKNTFAASAVAAAYLLANVVSCTDAAFAMEVADGPSSASDFTQSYSIVLAARSGGRAGGRAAPRMMSRPSSSTTTRVINQRTTVIAPPPIVMGGGYGYGYGGYYDPTPGIALNLGFSAVNAIGNGMRESRQNEMIYQERAELSASKEREAEMAARIRQLELMQMQQGGAGQQQQQPQIIIAQPTPVAVPAQ